MARLRIPHSAVLMDGGHSTALFGAAVTSSIRMVRKTITGSESVVTRRNSLPSVGTIDPLDFPGDWRRSVSYPIGGYPATVARRISASMEPHEAGPGVSPCESKKTSTVHPAPPESPRESKKSATVHPAPPEKQYAPTSDPAAPLDLTKLDPTKHCITCWCNGTRGDTQPNVALCVALQKAGFKVQ